ncbi:potassium voltage-gated channel subfamily C member 3 [Biomphalaria glabrata]|nr:potassium voltage-gated channel subfamily C member 3-like [Biomphalaria glabrata]KAI8773100.1 potassium voltage-gated channel subfamily C member 3 [Biomphalaria glabrata]
MSLSKGTLHALLPGARIDKHAKRIYVHAGTSNEIIRINVGGTVFETYKSTLSAHPSCHLSDPVFLAKYYRTEQNDYFFDRDPEIFHCILNYFRSGELHLPTSVCGLVIKSELDFWGIDDISIEECCWSRYATWASTLHALRRLEHDQNSLVISWAFPDKDNPSKLRQIRKKIWEFCSQPSSSRAAKVFAITSVIVIFVSISSFFASTHAPYRKYTDDNVSNASTKNETNNNTSRVQKYTELSSHPALVIIDIICLVFFSLELLTRTLVTPHRVKFLLLPMTIVEFLAVMTDLMDHLMRGVLLSWTGDETLLSVINFMKLLRVCRVFRLMRHVPGLWVLMYTVKASIKDLLLLFLFVVVGMLIFSSLIYFAEQATNPDFHSIPKCFWWAVVTMTTVGYGDMYPKTTWGYFVGAATGIAGVLLISFTVPVLVNNFILYYNYACALRTERETGRSESTREKRRRQDAPLAELQKMSRSAHSCDENGEMIEALLDKCGKTDLKDEQDRS